MRSDTIYQAASLSKPVFAYAVLKLAERGERDLDAPLSGYLSHPYVRDDAPGEGFGYSGEGYLYLQTVVEQVTGERLDAYIDESLLQPSGMTRSSYACAGRRPGECDGARWPR